MHFGGIKTDFFVYTFLYTAEIQGFLTRCFFMTHRILVRVSVAQKSQISGTLFFDDAQIFIQFCLYLSNFLHFCDTFWDTKTDFLFIHFYTVFIRGRNLRFPAHYFLMTCRMLLRMPQYTLPIHITICRTNSSYVYTLILKL